MCIQKNDNRCPVNTYPTRLRFGGATFIYNFHYCLVFSIIIFVLFTEKKIVSRPQKYYGLR